MKNILIDAGPLIALFDKDDKHHDKVKKFLQNFTGKLITTWSVITEVSHMLKFNTRIQIDFLKWLYLGGLKLFQIDEPILQDIIELSEKYSNVPMNLADATLVIASEKLKIKNILSIDSDFHIYRTLKKESFVNVLMK